MFARSSRFVFAILFGICSSLSMGQYVSTQDAENRKDELERQKIKAEANRFVGKTYWYAPNPKAAGLRLNFLSNPPTKWHSALTDRDKFFPEVTTSFVVTGVSAIQQFPDGPRMDRYFLEIKFPDEKVGYIDAKELDRHLYRGRKYDYEEYVYAKAPKDIAVSERIANDKAQAERRAKGDVRIGMTKEQVLASNWGKPGKVNKTITSAGTREQWVYGGTSYLYLTDGVLTAIQN